MRAEPIKLSLTGTDWSSEEVDLQGMDQVLLARMLFDVQVIQKFELAVLDLKNQDCVWGPVHTSVGQEAIAAGTVAALRPSDKFLGTHRSHHQFLSKALQYAVPGDWNPAVHDLTEEASIVVRRTMAEIMGLADGYCGGRGGSMHLRWKEAGFLGSNAIVAGGIPLATGAAFAEKQRKSGNIVVVFFGDGALNQGAFHEAANLAGLWNLPMIMVLENNEYAVATSIKNACAAPDVMLQAASYNMDAHVVQGHDIMALYHMIREVADRIRKGGAPCLVEAKCYRRFHHAGDLPGSAFKYRDKEEEKQNREREVIHQFPKLLTEGKVFTRKQVEHVEGLAKRAVEMAVDHYTISGEPRKVIVDFYPNPNTADEGTRSDGSEFKAIEFTERKDYTSFVKMKYSDAIAAATGRWLEEQPEAFILGEEVANFGGGAYGATKDLPDKYPDRVLNTPLSENGFTGLALGAAMSGMRPIVEIMFPDFTLVAADQVFNQIAKARHMYGNTTDLPLVIRTRIAIGCGYGGQHSMDPVGLYALFSGWRIVAPGNVFDYVGLFNSAMQSNDPVLIMEHNALYTEEFPLPENNLDYFIEFGKARIMQEGKDVSLIAYGYMAWRLERLASQINELGISAEIIDLRTVDLPSLDFNTIGESLKKTGVAVVIEEAPGNLSIGGKIAAELSERFFDYLDSPVMRLCSLDVPPSVSRILEKSVRLDDKQILEMVSLAAHRNWK